MMPSIPHFVRPAQGDMHFDGGSEYQALVQVRHEPLGNLPTALQSFVRDFTKLSQSLTDMVAVGDGAGMDIVDEDRESQPPPTLRGEIARQRFAGQKLAAVHSVNPK